MTLMAILQLSFDGEAARRVGKSRRVLLVIIEWPAQYAFGKLEDDATRIKDDQRCW